MTKAAVILSGCGYQDGAEIRESVLSLLALSRLGVEVQCFAPDVLQFKVANHLTGEDMDEARNVRVEAARIARGDVMELGALRVADFDLLVIPGGFGVALNLSDLALKGAEAKVLPDFKAAIEGFWKAKKPIAAICIAPAVLVAAIGKQAKPTVTIGEDAGTAAVIAALGGVHQVCETNAVVLDAGNRIVSCSAYMRDDSLARIAEGIEKCVTQAVEMARSKQAKVA